jgi:molecular chaperone GrpE
VTDNTGAADPQDRDPDVPTGPVIRDKRRLDPETGQVRQPAEPTGAAQQPVGGERDTTDGEQALGGAAGDAESGAPVAGPPESAAESEEHPDTRLAADRLEDLRRLQAEYVNYKRRVDRDRVRDREAGVTMVLEGLLPVLDDLHMAKEHGELPEGPLLSIADKLEATLGRFGVERVGAVGETFDPTVHEAMMHLPEADLPEGATETTIVQVMQPGFKVGDRVVRAARVAVADPA